MFIKKGLGENYNWGDMSNGAAYIEWDGSKWIEKYIGTFAGSIPRSDVGINSFQLIMKYGDTSITGGIDNETWQKIVPMNPNKDYSNISYPLSQENIVARDKQQVQVRVLDTISYPANTIPINTIPVQSSIVANTTVTPTILGLPWYVAIGGGTFGLLLVLKYLRPKTQQGGTV